MKQFQDQRTKKKKRKNHVLITILIRTATLRCGVIAGHLPLWTLFDAIDAAVGVDDVVLTDNWRRQPSASPVVRKKKFKFELIII